MSTLTWAIIWRSPLRDKILQSVTMIGNMLLQRGPSYSRMVSNQRIAFCCSLSSYFIFTMYSATLTSFMTADPPPITINTLKAALEHNYDILCRKESVVSQEILGEGSSFRKLADRFKFLDDEIIVQRLTDPGMEKEVYFGTPMWLQLRSKELVTIVPEVAFTNHYFFGFQPDSDIAQVMDHEIRKLREQGILEYLQRKWIPRKNGNKPALKNQTFSLDLLNVGFLFVVFGIGCFVSLMTLAWELTCFCLHPC